jgi:hypothetical protein
MVKTGTLYLINNKKDFISKGIQTISRFKTQGLFR